MENRTILVVEDNPVNQKLIKSLLAIGKYNVINAMDATSGIALARQHRPALILMDIQLPGMDGLSATREIRKDPDLKAIPVVAITAHAMQGDDKKALDAGCDGYISKPIDTRSFLSRIAEFLQKNRGPASTRGRKLVSYRKRLLIVDDEPVNIKLLEAKLAAQEYEIIHAESGKEALQKVEETPPDVILLDIMMPEMDGYEVTRRLKASPATQHIPIIIVTALTETKDKLHALDAGAEEFITKPVNGTELEARIQSMLRLKQYREQLDIRSRSESFFFSSTAQEEPLPVSPDEPFILLVEDDAKDVKLIQSYLHGRPFRIGVVSTGEEAVQYAQREKVDLILLDILLPGMDGYEVCRSLRESKHGQNMQIIIVTCLSDIDNRLRGLELGADDFLVKPINSRELIGRINILLKKKNYIDTLRNNYKKAVNTAMMDGLTGLYNQVYLKRFLDLEISRSIRYAYPVSLIMIDIDNFKKYNDSLGHLAGDAILREIGVVVQQHIRDVDLTVRYGGDEYAVVLPYADKETARGIFERISQAVAAHRFPDVLHMSMEKVTLSMGIAASPSDASSVDELIQKADEMLYKAKHEGKDRICVYQ